jgi:hypothetical protein
MIKKLTSYLFNPPQTVKPAPRASFFDETRNRLTALERGQDHTHQLLAAIIMLQEKGNDSMSTLAEALVKATAMVDTAMSHKTIEDAASAEIADLKTQLAAAQVNAADPATVNAIVAKIDLAQATLDGANAVVANTGVAGAPVTPAPVDPAPVAPPAA